ncbi:TIGR01841 family phasin [Undibacterium arcticum]|uniref:TIGR01841 family phasin n=1 Tax=Undibacterium arcticum TaxID=1762892 RepID=A0ABV7FAC3_9BURK
MTSKNDQFSNAAKANFESQLAAMTELTNKAFASVAQLVELNVSAAKASLEQSSAAAAQLLAAKDPQEFFALTSTQSQPNAENVLAYTRNLASIAAATRAEFAKAAEAQIVEATRKVTALVDEAAKNAPAGSENAIALLKSAISNANASYEQLTKTTKQTAETIEENVNKAVSQMSQTAEKAAGRAKK